MAIPEVKSFTDRVAELDRPDWLTTVDKLDTLQVNIGATCNLQCKHCHIQAGPDRNEEMSRVVMEACLKVFADNGFKVFDITGGAPELNPNYRWFVTEAARLADAADGKVITRTNLVILTEYGFDDLPAFWADLGVEVDLSLSSWEERLVDRQRGEGVFRRAIEGLKMLNAVGYGLGKTNSSGKKLIANLVMNPNGAFLPPAQASAEREFKVKLKECYGVTFDSLFTITNNPTGRFGGFLESRGTYDAYLKRLSDNFNPTAVENMMCRSQISVSWDGRLFDCDFNQALNWPLEDQSTVFSLAEQGVRPRRLRLGDHCYACTAGAGSSCGGATV